MRYAILPGVWPDLEIKFKKKGIHYHTYSSLGFILLESTLSPQEVQSCLDSAWHNEWIPKISWDNKYGIAGMLMDIMEAEGMAFVILEESENDEFEKLQKAYDENTKKIKDAYLRYGDNIFNNESIIQ